MPRATILFLLYTIRAPVNKHQYQLQCINQARIPFAYCVMCSVQCGVQCVGLCVVSRAQCTLCSVYFVVCSMQCVVQCLILTWADKAVMQNSDSKEGKKSEELGQAFSKACIYLGIHFRIFARESYIKLNGVALLMTYPPPTSFGKVPELPFSS